MTKKITLTVSFILVVCSLTFGQDKFIYDQKGLNPKYVVVEIDSLEQNEIFTKTINWIKETYKNPDEVIKTTIDNEKIRIEGYDVNSFSYKSMGDFSVDVLYTIEISFKNGRYKFQPIELKSKFQPSGCYQPGEYFKINLSDGSEYYKNNGKLKCSNNLPSSISNLLNSLNENLIIYLTKPQTEDDW